MPYNTRGSQILGNFDFNSAPPRVIGANLSNSEFQNVPSDQSTAITGYGTTAPLKWGTQYTTYDGRVFKYVELADTTALTEGDLIVPYTNSASGTSAATSATDSTVVTATMASVLANQYIGGFLSCTVGTGLGQTRRIVGNTATTSGSVTFYLERAFTTSLASATVIAYHPYRVKKLPGSLTAGVPISGVSYGAIAAATAANGQYNNGISYYGWMQVAGFCERVKFKAAVDTVAATATQSLGLVASDTAGSAAQWVATLANVIPFGHMVPTFNAAITAPGSVAAWLTNCQG